MTDHPRADKIAELKARIGILDQKIKDPEAREYLLWLPKNWLGDVEQRIVPGVEVMLSWIEQLISQAEFVVAAYGEGVRIISA